ncbi:nucleoside/nucleotide kinase family protein [Microtetraspora sp. NBRC 16547]|uniref:nucleoside/nucleotide kinase family protein n=1 Tax=Microtetraspora sp. NBRC 16547 TaxID=3030993 RepID=UPI0024A5E81B|nr:nucleoside/nucleotide kinase family protein [Microtetraspora sp. NBRC 16547]GLX02484.1 nucleoside/nucleotide kinase family protein [Microtetraspora sp. NBRC 16547]
MDLVAQPDGMSGMGADGRPDLVRRAVALAVALAVTPAGAADGGRPAVLGIAGKPGAGKSTLAAALTEALNLRLPGAVVLAPMDGFHLSNEVLAGLGLRDRKGAPETFDAWGYLALLERIRGGREPVVYAPTFDRAIEEPVAGAVPIPRTARLVITEGNYLLLDEEPWGRIRALLDEVWYVEVADELRLDRLTARHAAFGKPPEEARAWATGSDERNAALIGPTAGRADLRIRLDG